MEIFKPRYSKWRHGGWYVHNVKYPSGACGCVSNDYPDKQWRMVCGPQDVTFPSRDAAARGEHLYTLHARVIAEATELLRNATYADGVGSVLTQDCEMLKRALADCRRAAHEE